MTEEKNAAFTAEEIADFREAIRLGTEMFTHNGESLQYGNLEQHLRINTAVLNAQIQKLKDILENAPDNIIQMVNSRLPKLLRDVVLVDLMGNGTAEYGIVYRVRFGFEYERLISEILTGKELPHRAWQLIEGAEAMAVSRERFQLLLSVCGNAPGAPQDHER